MYAANRDHLSGSRNLAETGSCVAPLDASLLRRRIRLILVAVVQRKGGVSHSSRSEVDHEDLDIGSCMSMSVTCNKVKKGFRGPLTRPSWLRSTMDPGSYEPATT